MTLSSASRRHFALSLGAALCATVVRPSASAAAPSEPVAPSVIDLSSNENPYGLSATALEAMTRSQAVAARYPELGSRELAWMKPDAILINVARGEIIDERALHEHLKEDPNFMVGIDAWWIEPLRHGEFRIDYPFFELPSFLGSPHNSAVVPGIMVEAVRDAAENVMRFLRGKPISGLVRREDYVGPD